jgi:alpha-tubulin suppressor-like RCC1 family protein
MAALGIGTLVDSPTPADVAGLMGAAALGAGYHTCARFPDGSLRCAGWNLYGQCGDATTTTRRTPVDVVEGCCALSEATALTTGYWHNCVVQSVGPPLCWGNNSEGQLGDGTTVNRRTPVPVTDLAGATALAAGRAHTCAVIGDGSARCWGQNLSGQLGDGTVMPSRRTTPGSVIGLAGPVIAIAPGGNHTCAIVAGGSVQCWGGNSFGQIGIGETRSYSTTTPVTVTGISNATFLTTKAEHTCALLADGSIRCWGANTRGQIGDGTTDDAMVPVAVVGVP